MPSDEEKELENASEILLQKRGIRTHIYHTQSSQVI